MKIKALTFVVVILACLMFIVSCNFVNTPLNNYESSCVQTNGDSEHKSEASTINDETIDENLNVDAESIYLSTFEQYSSFIKSIDLPDDFISYSMLEEIGTFHSFVVPSSDYLSYYGYHLMDENGFQVDIFVTHFDKKPEIGTFDTETVQLQIKPATGFLSGKNFESKKVSYNDIQYTYDSAGSLRYITTVLGDVMISVSPGSMFDNNSKKVVEMDFVDYKPSTANLVTYLIDGNESHLDIARYLASKNQQ